jgi:hypothetical protein
MIVTENNVHSALEYLAADPHPVAEARHKLTVAENNAKTIYSRLFLSSKEGSDKRREADVLQNVDYLQAQSVVAEAIFEHERHRQRVNAADKLIAVWQSENANARAAERVR